MESNLSNIPQVQEQYNDMDFMNHIRELEQRIIPGDTLSDVSSIDENNFEKIIIKDTVFSISSLDRDWYNSTLETPFNFNVRLGSGLQNNYMMINYEPKNIVSINLDKVLINGKNTNISYTSNANTDISHTPYLYVTAEDIDSITQGTNQKFQNALGVIAPEHSITSTDLNYRHISYINILKKAKEYHNNPLASLSKLNISITDQLGESPKTYNDVLNVSNITYNPAVSSNVATEFLVIKTLDYFPMSQYSIGDKIKIQNYEQENNGSVYIDEFEKFINRDVGHTIIGIDVTDNDKLLKNRIHIPAPISISQSTGNVVEDTWYTNIKDLTTLRSSSSIDSFTDTSGKLINTNLQTIMIVKVKTLEKEANFMI